MVVPPSPTHTHTPHPPTHTHTAGAYAPPPLAAPVQGVCAAGDQLDGRLVHDLRAEADVPRRLLHHAELRRRLRGARDDLQVGAEAGAVPRGGDLAARGGGGRRVPGLWGQQRLRRPGQHGLQAGGGRGEAVGDPGARVRVRPDHAREDVAVGLRAEAARDLARHAQVLGGAVALGHGQGGGRAARARRARRAVQHAGTRGCSTSRRTNPPLLTVV